MTTFATVDQLSAAWRPLTPDERAVAGTLLARASRLLGARVAEVDARIASGSLDPLLVADVVCEMVRRAFTTRVAGAESSTTTVGQVSQAVTYANPQSNLYLTKAERALLSPTRRTGAFSVSTLPAC